MEEPTTCPKCGSKEYAAIGGGWNIYYCNNCRSELNERNVFFLRVTSATYRDAFAELLLLQYGTGCTADKLWQQAQKYAQMKRDREDMDAIDAPQASRP